MKKKILLSLALVAVMCFSVSAVNTIEVYNNRFMTPTQAGTWGNHGAALGALDGWVFTGNCSLSTNIGAGGVAGGTFRYCPISYYGQAAGAGWGGGDITQQIPGPTIRAGYTTVNYSTTEFVSGTTYTVTYSYLKDPNVAGAQYEFFVVNKDEGMGVLNYRPVDITHAPRYSWCFMSTNIDFTSVSRTNRIVFRNLGYNTSIVFNNITIEETSNKNWGLEVGSFHGWTETGDAFNGAPLDNDGGVAIGGYDGDWYACSRAARNETFQGTLKSRDFTIPENGYVQFKLGGYSYNPAITNVPIYNYVTLNDAESGAQLGDKIYCPQTTGSMVITNIIPPTAYMGSGSNVCLNVVDDSTVAAYGWLSFDSLETKVIPEPATLGLLAILGLAFLRRK